MGVRPAEASEVDVVPGFGQVEFGDEEPGAEDIGPAPGLAGEPQRHGGSAVLRSDLSAQLDEVAPGGQQEGALDEGLEAACEGDGVAAVVCGAVSDESVKGVSGAQSAVAGSGGV